MDKKRNAFTMAETLIVVVVLGIIATLVIPNLINKQRETTNRTKLKKAMADYETAVNKMILENNHSFSGLDDDCDKKVSYFKYIKRDTDNTCIFETSDKVLWDVSKIQRTLIALKEDDLTVENANDSNNKKAFVLVGRIDDQGILRVNDLGYESGEGHSVKDDYGYESKDQVAKSYSFIRNKKSEDNGGGDTPTEGIFGSSYASFDDFPECEDGQYEYCVRSSSDVYSRSKTYYFANDNGGVGVEYSCNDHPWEDEPYTSCSLYHYAYSSDGHRTGPPDYYFDDCGSLEECITNSATCSPINGDCPEPVDGKYSFTIE